MALYLFLVLANAFCFTRVEAACQVPPPVVYPISNVSLSKASARRDLGILVGRATPGFSSQPMALTINADWNNTIFYTTDGKCSNRTTAQCTFDRGGAYNTKASSSFQQLNASSGGLNAEFRAADNGLNAVVTVGEDILTIGKQDVSMQIFTPSSNTLPQSALGLGRKSTFVETLYEKQLIASRTWSLFWGLEGADPISQMDGSLIIGGYDRAKTTGPNMTQPFSSLADQASCPTSMIVEVTDLALTFANGTSVSLLGNPLSFRACIKPDVPLVTLPTDVFAAFNTTIGGAFLAPSDSYKLWGMDFAATGIFDGSLTYTFNSGLRITIPNSQLVVPDVQVTSAGTTFIPDESARELLVYADPVTGSDMPLLGQVFMTAAYLHVNNDKQEFTMWQAQPTLKTDIVVVGDACITADPSPSPEQPAPHPPSQVTLSPIEIAGIAIGGALSIALSALCGYGLQWYLRRRRLRLIRETESTKEIPWNNNVGINRFSKAELAGSTTKVPTVLKYELHADADRKHGARKSLPKPPGWSSARQVGGPCELPAQ